MSFPRCSMGRQETCTHIILMPEYDSIKCKGLQTAHQYTHDYVSICLCPGALQGTWKCASIIPLPRHNALIQHAHPVFLTIQTPKQLVLSNLSMINVSHFDNLQCLLALPLPLGTSMPHHINTNAITNKTLTPW